MSTAVRNLEPKALWNHFADLNQVPRPSKKEERVTQFQLAIDEYDKIPELINTFVEKVEELGPNPFKGF